MNTSWKPHEKHGELPHPLSESTRASIPIASALPRATWP
jgi:hypothetical protein